MLTIHGRKQKFCDGITRRGFFRIGALGAGLTLADVLRLRADAPAASVAPKSAIMILLHGGPSHIDMYDLKPNAPAEIRGEFRAIATNVPGVQISEHFPLQAKIWDKLAVIRSVIPIDQAHTDAGITTGYSDTVNRVEHHPTIGCVISKLRAESTRDIPPYVSLRGPGLEEPGFLGVAHRPFNPRGPGLNDLRLSDRVDAQRLAQRKDLLAAFDTVRRDIDSSGSMRGMDSFTTRAFDMVTSGAVRKALDVSREPAPSRERYKDYEEFLLARRLVEAGVGCVTLGVDGSVWDTHHNNFATLKRVMPKLDRALSTLVQDLHARGLDKDVVVMMCGEFGRTARITSEAGRDHWSPVMSVVMAGGGLKMGQAIGSTDARAEYPKDRPYPLQRVLSTLYQAVGIDPATALLNQNGRPVPLLDDREPVRELM